MCGVLIQQNILQRQKGNSDTCYTRMNPEDVTLSEGSQTQKEKYFIIPFIRGAGVGKYIQMESGQWLPGPGGGGRGFVSHGDRIPL